MSVFGMSKTVLKNLFTNPATKMYPIRPQVLYKNTRGKIAIEIDKCIFCGICSKKCPTSAIEVTRDSKSWQIDRLRCIACNACVDACPKKCLVMENEYSKPTTGKNVDLFKGQEVTAPKVDEN